MLGFPGDAVPLHLGVMFSATYAATRAATGVVLLHLEVMFSIRGCTELTALGVVLLHLEVMFSWASGQET